ncbi:hypothetical protein HDU97_001979, partial [Phlyctochytrium planicorne]
ELSWNIILGSLVRFTGGEDPIALPEELGELKNLQTFEMSFNNFLNVSMDLSRLKSLQSLQISDCQFSTLDFVRDLPALQSLDVSYSALEAFPSSFETLKNLRTMKLDSNKLQSIEGLQNCPNLRTLSLPYNALKAMPASISKNSLASMDLTWNKLESVDGIDGTFTALKAIIILQPTVAEFPVRAECIILGLPTFRRVLSNNQLESIEGLKNCSNLKTLTLTSNLLKTVPSTISQATSLSYIDLNSNTITSLDGIETLVNLQTLKADSNSITALPASLGNLKGLSILDLSNNVLETIDGFQNLTKLNFIYLSNNQLQTFPDGFQSSKRLFTINVNNNKIKTIAGNFTAMKYAWIDLDLSGNQIQDYGTLGTFPFIHLLSLKNNSLQEVPSFIKATNGDLSVNNIMDFALNFSKIKMFQSIDVSSNRIQTLDGTIFPQTLTTLMLSQNNFTSVPTSLRNYTGITTIDLNSNWINGTVNPETFPVNLKSISIYINCFDVIPDFPQVRAFFQRSKEDCYQHFNPNAVITTSISLSTTSQSLATTMASVFSTSITASEVSFTSIPSIASPEAAPTTATKRVLPLIPTNSFLPATKIIVQTQPNSFQTDVPTDTPDGIPDPTPTPTATTSIQEDLTGNNIFKSKYLLPGTVVATMVFVVAMAGLVFLFIRRRQVRKPVDAIPPPADSEPSTNSTHTTESDLEAGSQPSQPFSKDGLLFQDGVLTQGLWHQPIPDKSASTLFSPLSRIETGKRSEDLESAPEHREAPFSTCLNLYSSSEGGLVQDGDRDGEEKDRDLKEDDVPVLARVEPRQETCLNLFLEEEKDTDNKDGSVSEKDQVIQPVVADNAVHAQDPSTSVHSWTPAQVQTWMNAVGFQDQVLDTFSRHQIDGQRLLGLTDRILERELGISQPSLRSSILMIRAGAFMNLQQDDF